MLKLKLSHLNYLLALTIFFSQLSFGCAQPIAAPQPLALGKQSPPIHLTSAVPLGAKPKQHSSSSLSTQGVADALDADAELENQKEKEEREEAVKLKAERCTTRKHGCCFALCFGIVAASIYAVVRTQGQTGSTDPQCVPSTMPYNTIDMQDACWDLELHSNSGAANVTKSCLCPVEGVDNSTALRAWTMANLMAFQALNSNNTSIRIRPNMKPCRPFNGCADPQQTVAQIKNSFRNVPAAHRQRQKKFKYKR
jgi:hypothetical protein